MKIYIQRASRDKNGWRLRFSATGNAFTGNLLTSVVLGRSTGYDNRMSLPSAIKEGEKLARENFEEMREFNR